MCQFFCGNFFNLGSYHFLPGGGAVCLWRLVANFFWSPPFAYVKKFWSPPLPTGKNFAPPPWRRQKILAPPRWKNFPLTQSMEGVVIRLKSECAGGWEKIWLYINILCGMKYGNEKRCAEGAKNFWITYLRSNSPLGPTETKKLVPPFDHPEKFWSPPHKQMPPPPGKKW